jgi:tetratricopeptide (TPR) repeat protein
MRYYNSKDYEKAAPLLKDVCKQQNNTTYFRYYINSLIELKNYEEAEQALQKEIKKQKDVRPEFYAMWGKVLKSENKDEEADAKYREAIEKIAPNKSSYITTANILITMYEFDLAKEAYLKGRKVLGDEKLFGNELAHVYMYLHDYDNMMNEYLNILRDNEKQIYRIQSYLSSLMRLDTNHEICEQFREQVLKRIQAEPNIISYNRILIWIFLQENKFPNALRQSIALDKRTGDEASQIAQLGNLALKNKEYGEAKKAFKYLTDKGDDSPYFKEACARTIHASYMEYINNFSGDIEKGKELAIAFDKALEKLTINESTLYLVRENAHLLAFYLNDTDKALRIIDKGISVPRLKPDEIGKLKTEKADIYVYANDQWEAFLLYSQVIDANKNSSLGDDVKLKKATLGYYMGNFSWAKAQLDVLKASTSKLTANDAMALSMLISSNLENDTSAIPLTMFAKADLLFFQNKSDEALAELDSLITLYPYNSLTDDILYRKAKIEIEHNNYSQATEHLENIVNNYSYDLLGDDALYMLAEIYNYNLNEKEKAKELYKQMLTAHPGSVYVEESRAKYRELRKIYPDKETIIKEQPDGKSLFQHAIENIDDNN